jgi:hypothetical protein
MVVLLFGAKHGEGRACFYQGMYGSLIMLECGLCLVARAMGSVTV